MLLDKSQEGQYEGMSERDIFYKVLLDLKKDVNDLKKVVFGLLDTQDNGSIPVVNHHKSDLTNYRNYSIPEDARMLHSPHPANEMSAYSTNNEDDEQDFIDAETLGIEENNSLSLESREIELIKIALLRNNGKRKKAAEDLGISERTLYRKIKQYELE
jgi:DNA-binding NtrC family response regulator